MLSGWVARPVSPCSGSSGRIDLCTSLTCGFVSEVPASATSSEGRSEILDAWMTLEAEVSAAPPQAVRVTIPAPRSLGAENAARPCHLDTGQEANAFVAPVLGLPELPFIAWPSPRDEPGDGVFWKPPEIVAWVKGRAFAWIDDEITEADRTWVKKYHSGPRYYTGSTLAAVLPARTSPHSRHGRPVCADLQPAGSRLRRRSARSLQDSPYLMLFPRHDRFRRPVALGR